MEIKTALRLETNSEVANILFDSETLNKDLFTSRLVIGTSRTVGSAKRFVRITSGFGGGEFTKTLRKDSWYNQEPPPFNKSTGPGRDQEPPRERPGSFNRRPSPSYQEILDSKRRQEASYRRFDDQEYSRLGGPQGGLGTDYSRPQEGPSDGYMGRYD